MRLDDFIQTAINNVLKNPVLSVLRDINFSSILKQSNFIKRDIGKSPYFLTFSKKSKNQILHSTNPFIKGF
ncbi:hypothetical protein [Aliarcobacter cryaerophilus]|uniref:Uncharacterized protein n=1 Tax=Aliarcobacter cryaerophilus TaxID=28198 RepID=A0A2S9SL82_9BACT|nr:hypothetical protein [Aliarcobacter cryaerophilus]PRM87347.1 hypothetical protein CJ669_08045 [Aliarcobacter cryaerophilus]